MVGCFLCGSQENLSVHHPRKAKEKGIHYVELIGEEVILCQDCHFKIHHIKGGTWKESHRNLHDRFPRRCRLCGKEFQRESGVHRKINLHFESEHNVKLTYFNYWKLMAAHNGAKEERDKCLRNRGQPQAPA